MIFHNLDKTVTGDKEKFFQQMTPGQITTTWIKLNSDFTPYTKANLYRLKDCSCLDKNAPHRHRYLNTWLPAGGAVWEMVQSYWRKSVTITGVRGVGRGGRGGGWGGVEVGSEHSWSLPCSRLLSLFEVFCWRHDPWGFCSGFPAMPPPSWWTLTLEL